MTGKKLRVLVRLLVLVFSTAVMLGIIFFALETWDIVYLLLVPPLAITVDCVTEKYDGGGTWTSWRAFFEIKEKK